MPWKQLKEFLFGCVAAIAGCLVILFLASAIIGPITYAHYWYRIGVIAAEAEAWSKAYKEGGDEAGARVDNGKRFILH